MNSNDMDDERAALQSHIDVLTALQEGDRLGMQAVVKERDDLWRELRKTEQDSRDFHEAAAKLVSDMMDAMLAEKGWGECLSLHARVNAILTAQLARAASPQPVAQPVEPVSNDQIAKWARRMTLPLDDSECIALVQEIIAAQPVEQTAQPEKINDVQISGNDKHPGYSSRSDTARHLRVVPDSALDDEWNAEFHKAAMTYRAASIMQAPDAFENLKAIAVQPVEQTRALTDACKRLASYVALLRAEALPKGELVARDIETLLTAARPASGETE